jgi:hypothetical protein
LNSVDKQRDGGFFAAFDRREMKTNDGVDPGQMTVSLERIGDNVTKFEFLPSANRRRSRKGKKNLGWDN